MQKLHVVAPRLSIGNMTVLPWLCTICDPPRKFGTERGRDQHVRVAHPDAARVG